MGIKGLLKVLSPITKKNHLREFMNKRAVVDGYVWLHKGCISCAREIALGLKTRSYVKYFLKQIDLLLKFSIQPIIVFDGAFLPAKKATHLKRNESRKLHLAQGQQLEKRGLNAEAMEHYKSAICIDFELLIPLFAELENAKIQFIVAPYEADAQISYLVRNGLADFAISEDSDLIVYKCPVMVYKLDKDGSCSTIHYNDIFSMDLFSNFNDKMLLEACVLSGCDYLDSPRGLGIKKAIKLISEYKNSVDALKAAEESGKFDFPPCYKEHFNIAVDVFLQQKVYDPMKEITVATLKDGSCPESGEHLSPYMAKLIAMGRMNPNTHVEVERSAKEIIDMFLAVDAPFIRHSYGGITSKNVFYSKPKERVYSSFSYSRPWYKFGSYSNRNSNYRYMY